MNCMPECHARNMMNARFKGEIRKNRHLPEHLPEAHARTVAHDQKLLHMIKKFESARKL